MELHQELALTVRRRTFHSVPQKLPTFDSASLPSWPLNMAVQGLPLKHCSPGAHSSPRGQGVLFAQSLLCSAQEVPQKFVLITGDFVGDGVVGDEVGAVFDVTVSCCVLVTEAGLLATAAACCEFDVVGEV